MKHCRHCETPFLAKADSEEFCCLGCQVVHRLLIEQGLENFYEERESGSRPVRERAFIKVDPVQVAEIQSWVDKRRDGERVVVSKFGISGMSCAGCSWLIEKLCREMCGIQGAEASLVEGVLFLTTDREFSVDALLRSLARFGYQVVSFQIADNNPQTWLFPIVAASITVTIGLLALSERYLFPIGAFPALGNIVVLLAVALQLHLSSRSLDLKPKYKSDYVSWWGMAGVLVIMGVCYLVFRMYFSLPWLFSLTLSSLTLNLVCGIYWLFSNFWRSKI